MKQCAECKTTEAKTWKGRYCPKCSSRLYRERHPNYQKDRYRKNPELANYYAKKWREENVDKVVKTRKDSAVRNSVSIKKRNDRAHRSIKSRIRGGKERAIKKGFSWTLSEDDYKNLINQPCYYCNNLLGSKVEVGVGLDRLDNTIGYEIGNVVSSCRSCNVMRNNILTPEETKLVVEFIIQLRRITSSP